MVFCEDSCELSYVIELDLMVFCEDSCELSYIIELDLMVFCEDSCELSYVIELDLILRGTSSRRYTNKRLSSNEEDH